MRAGVRSAIGALIPLVSVFIWVPLQDPFNFPKFLLLLIIGSLGLPFIAYSWQARDQRLLFGLSGAFVAALLLATVASDVRFMSVFGVHGRNTGLLSYLALVSIFLFIATSQSQTYLKIFPFLFAIALGLNLLYSLLQHFNHDPIPWKNPFNPIVGFLGNPNFAASFLGIGAGLAIWLVLSTEFKIYVRAIGFLLTPLLFIVIWWSQSRQGLITYFVSAGVVLSVYLLRFSKSLASLSVAGIFAVLVGIGLGIFNAGPLARFVYEGSLQARQSYWKQAIDMFRDHPWTGVGLDRFGAYFYQYRTNEDATNVLFNTSTDNAHNVPLHLLGTGGVFVFLTYVGLMMLIAVYGLKTLKFTTGNEQMRVGLALALWSAYQVQSLISIDQLGIAIWNWVFAGVIFGYFFTNSSQATNKLSVKSVSEPPISRVGIRSGISIALIAAVFTVLGPQWKSEVQLRLGLAVENDPNNPAVKVNAMTYPVLNGFLESSYYFEMGTRALFAYGLAEDGQKFGLKTIELDPRNYVAWSAIAELGEGTNQRAAAIPYRLKTTELDPNNPKVWVELMRDYKAAGKYREARAAGERAIPLLTGFSMSIFKYDAETIKRELAQIPNS